MSEITAENKHSLLEFLKEDNGNYSSTRLLFLAWGFTILFSWVFLSIYTLKLQPIDVSVAGVFASLGATKIVQKFGEEKTK